MTLRLWHRIAIPAGLIALALIVGLIAVAMVAQEQASRQIEQRGNLLLEEQTERFLSSLVGGVAEGADAHLGLAHESLFLIGQMAFGGKVDHEAVLSRLLVTNDSAVAAFVRFPDGDPQVRLRGEGRQPVNASSELAHLSDAHATYAGGVTWLEARESGWARIGGAVVDAVVAVPMEEGTGYLGVSLSMGDLARRMNRRLPLPGSYFFIMDSSQQLIAAPPHSRLDLAGGGVVQASASPDLSRLAPESLRQALGRVGEGQAMLERVTLRGQSRYLTYQPLTHADWRIGLVVPVSLAQQVSREMVEVVEEGSEIALRTMVVWALVILVIIIALATLLSHRLVKPLSHVSQVAESIAYGDLESRVKVRGNDEIARLGRSFNTMADRVSDAIHNLEARVEERTDEADAARVRFQRILESSPVGIAFFNENGELEEVNPAFRRLMGWAETDAAVRNSLPEAFRAIAEEARRKLADHGSFEAEKVLPRLDGAAFSASLKGSPARSGTRDAGFILVIQDISEQKALETKLERQASHDQLTGVMNRWKFTTQLQAAMDHCYRYGRDFSLIMFDLDDFKSINDTHGHNVGDEVLKKLARSIQPHLRAGDSMARWGGEEFIVLLPETDLEQAKQFAERLRSMVADLTFSENVTVTISLGVAQYQGEAEADQLVRRADDALYQAKNGGRNRVVLAQ